MAATATQPMDYAALPPDDAAARINSHSALRATPYRWPDPASLPRRQWLMGHWLLRGEVTAIIAPGGTGKSTIGNTIALCLASGQPLLGKPLHRGPQAVWIFNLEDGTDELERQLSAACAYHGIGPMDCGDRLHLDSGLVQPLCTASEDRDGFTLAEDVFAQLAATIRERRVATVIVDPFVSSHAVRESSNEAIDAIAKRWKRLAQETGCAVVLVHHTRKLGGREVTAEDGRGAVALRDAARVVLPLNPMGDKEAEELGIADPALRRSLVRIDTGKANRAPPDAATWIKLESQSLDNGDGLEPSDFVGVATLWEKPDVFHGLTTWHLFTVQQRLAAGDWRDSVQAKNWVGHLVATVAALSAETDRGRIKAIIRTWKRNGALAVEHRAINGREVPFVIVGNPVDASEIGSRPHLATCGAESAEGAGADP
ncbi:AAA family ATPase [Sphingopyxis sp. GC21]|uniref:AAA family ATPase n=1 Tax=Sphingopyxis sp. GC21 TaxID=2933562 RepID=UPI0021E46CE3|nr:AAA family ATPase [Sphingopyxis sp. GC21]